MNCKLSLSLVLVLLVISCASPIPKHIETLGVSNICCGNTTEIVFDTIDADGRKNILVTDKDPSYKFFEGKSFFKAYELPSNLQSGDYVRIYSHFNSLLASSNYIFYPYILFLDKGKNIVRYSGKLSLNKTSNTWAASGEQRYVELAIEENVKYIVVYTAENILGEQIETRSTENYGMIYPGLMMPTGHSTKTYTGVSPFGEISIQFLLMREHPHLALAEALKDYFRANNAYPSSLVQTGIADSTRRYFTNPIRFQKMIFRDLGHNLMQVDFNIIYPQKNDKTKVLNWVISVNKVEGIDKKEYFYTSFHVR